MSKFILSLFFKTNLSAFRSAILANDTNRICRILDIEREHISKELDTSGNTALLLAIKHATPLTVHVLLEQGAHPDQVNSYSLQTPLSILASKVYENLQSQEAKTALEMAKIILSHGAYIDKPSPFMFIDENGKDYPIKETPLMTAVRTKNLPMAALLIDKKANVNYIDKQTQNRPIHFSIANGDVEMFDLLDKAGVVCHSVVTTGDNTLLHWFCYNTANDENISLLKKLIDKGCDVNTPNDLQRTPLMIAAKLNMIKTCHVLLNSSADIDAVDYQGYRAIDLAKPDSDCFILLQEAKRKRSQTKRHHKERILYKKQIAPTRSLSTQRIDLVNSSDTDESQRKFNSISTCDVQNLSDQEFDTKYKRMWEKVLQTKHKIRRTRDVSLQRSSDCSRQRMEDLSQSRINDINVATVF